MIDITEILELRGKKVSDLIVCFYVNKIWVFKLHGTVEDLNQEVLDDLNHVIEYTKELLNVDITREFIILDEEKIEFVNFDLLSYEVN